MPKPSDRSTDPLVDELILAFLQHADGYYVKNGRHTSSMDEIRRSLRPLHERFGGLPVSELGPLAIKDLRANLVAQGTWCRTTINKTIGVIKRMFKWGVENELVSPNAYQRLQAISGLRRGRSEARESEGVKPIAEEHVQATLVHVSPQVAAMIQVQLLTGMRPGEVIAMRGCDLDTSGKLWTYTPASHKTEHHGRQRIIHLGPRAQEVVRPFLRHDLDAFLFDPSEAEQERRARQHAQRKTPLRYGNRPGTNRKRKPKVKPKECYTVGTYRRAIERGCEKAFPPPGRLQPKVLENGQREARKAFMARLSDTEKAELKAWNRSHRWHPNQLRHTAATRLRKQFGIEAARVVLGHSSAVVTEIYAEMDLTKAAQIMSEAG